MKKIFLILILLIVFSFNKGFVLSFQVANSFQSLRRVHNIQFFTTQPTQKFRIVFDLIDTLIGFDFTQNKTVLRDGADLLIKELKNRGHTVILVTTGSQKELDFLKTGLPGLNIFLSIFDEIYTEVDESEIAINGRVIRFKDITEIQGDFLIDDNDKLELIAKQIGMEGKLIQVFPFEPSIVASGEIKPFDWIVNIVVPPIQNLGG